MRICLILAVVLAGLFVLQPVKDATSQEKPAVTKWEYGVLTMPIDHPKTNQMYVWATGSDTVIGHDWDEFAKQMKLEKVDKKSFPESVRVRMLNSFGANGWELVSQVVSETPEQQRFTFKRRLP